MFQIINNFNIEIILNGTPGGEVATYSSILVIIMVKPCSVLTGFISLYNKTISSFTDRPCHPQGLLPWPWAGYSL